jgi:solute carrier family 25 (peroxisomal adenine nucleotide transporter), member 17
MYFCSEYAYFFFYSFVRTSYLKARKTVRISVGMELVLGALAGALAQIFTIPVAVIATRQQVGRPKSAAEKAADIESGKPREDVDSFLNIAREIIKEDGVTGLWLGLKPGLVLTVNPAITYGLFEYVKGAVTARAFAFSPFLTWSHALHSSAVSSSSSGSMTGWQTFSTGALSKTLATVVTYPYIMAKVRLQARTAGDLFDDDVEAADVPEGEKKPVSKINRNPGAIDILAQVLKTKGLVGWYQVSVLSVNSILSAVF